MSVICDELISCISIMHISVSLLNYKVRSAINFQRISVTVSDLGLFYGVYRLSKNLYMKRRSLIWVLIVWSPALVIVDHMHFQYNGFFIWVSCCYLFRFYKKEGFMRGFHFAVLLCFMHQFAVAAPVYLYLLRHYCWKGLVKGFWRLLVMGAVGVAVFAAAYGPFVYHGQIQVFRRMFPFGRGLCCWAPNFWVFYIILDKVFAFFLRKLGSMSTFQQLHSLVG